MKVLKEGNWKNPWSKEIDCSVKDCSATLLVEEKDLKAPTRYEDDSARYIFTCPVCGKDNDLSCKGLPNRVKETLDTKRTVHRSSSGWRD